MKPKSAPRPCGGKGTKGNMKCMAHVTLFAVRTEVELGLFDLRRLRDPFGSTGQSMCRVAYTVFI